MRKVVKFWKLLVIVLVMLLFSLLFFKYDNLNGNIVFNPNINSRVSSPLGSSSSSSQAPDVSDVGSPDVNAVRNVGSNIANQNRQASEDQQSDEQDFEEDSLSKYKCIGERTTQTRNNDQPGLIDNWRFDQTAWNNEYQNKLNSVNSQNGNKPINYFSGSSYSLTGVNLVNRGQVFSSDHANIQSTATSNNAPVLATFENGNLGGYTVDGNSPNYQFDQDVSYIHQCDGNRCLVFTTNPQGDDRGHTYVRTNFKAVDGVKTVTFLYSGFIGYGGNNGNGRGSLPGINVYIQDINGNNLGPYIVPAFVQNCANNICTICPSQDGMNFCPATLQVRDLRRFSLDISGIPKNNNYNLIIDFYSDFGPTSYSVDNIQFLDVNGNEYGGSRSSGGNYNDVYTEINTVKNIQKNSLGVTRFKNPGGVTYWSTILNTQGLVNIPITIKSSIPNDVSNPEHVLLINGNNNVVRTTSTDNSNKKDYSGNFNVPVTNNGIILSARSNHKYYTANTNAFTDDVWLAADNSPPTISARIVPLYNNLITTETPLLAYVNVGDDVGLATISYSKKDSNARETILMENLVYKDNVNGIGIVPAVESLGKSYTGVPIKINPLLADAKSIKFGASDWVYVNGATRFVYTNDIPLSTVYDLTNKFVSCNKYTPNVGESITCNLPSNIPANHIAWVRNKDERGSFTYDSFSSIRQVNGQPKPKELFYNQVTNTFSATVPGTYDIELLVYDDSHNIVRRSGKVARIIVSGPAPSLIIPKPVAVGVKDRVKIFLDDSCKNLLDGNVQFDVYRGQKYICQLEQGSVPLRINTNPVTLNTLTTTGYIDNPDYKNSRCNAISKTYNYILKYHTTQPETITVDNNRHEGEATLYVKQPLNIEVGYDKSPLNIPGNRAKIFLRLYDSNHNPVTNIPTAITEEDPKQLSLYNGLRLNDFVSNDIIPEEDVIASIKVKANPVKPTSRLLVMYGDPAKELYCVKNPKKCLIDVTEIPITDYKFTGDKILYSKENDLNSHLIISIPTIKDEITKSYFDFYKDAFASTNVKNWIKQNPQISETKTDGTTITEKLFKNYELEDDIKPETAAAILNIKTVEPDEQTGITKYETLYGTASRTYNDLFNFYGNIYNSYLVNYYTLNPNANIDDKATVMGAVNTLYDKMEKLSPSSDKKSKKLSKLYLLALNSMQSKINSQKSAGACPRLGVLTSENWNVVINSPTIPTVEKASIANDNCDLANSAVIYNGNIDALEIADTVGIGGSVQIGESGFHTNRAKINWYLSSIERNVRAHPDRAPQNYNRILSELRRLNNANKIIFFNPEDIRKDFPVTLPLEADGWYSYGDDLLFLNRHVCKKAYGEFMQALIIHEGSHVVDNVYNQNAAMQIAYQSNNNDKLALIIAINSVYTEAKAYQAQRKYSSFECINPQASFSYDILRDVLYRSKIQKGKLCKTPCLESTDIGKVNNNGFQPWTQFQNKIGQLNTMCVWDSPWTQSEKTNYCRSIV